MAATRKLQGEIDRCLKKVTEGVETFEDIWQKVHNATNSNQKEKYEADLKKEIKKLQRLRDQIKSWIASAEIKDKSALLEYRRLIETQMERFKVVERETKTKAYSKEGLGAAQKQDPAQRVKEETRTWLTQSISSLQIQIDQYESEVESLLAGKKKRLDRDKQERMDELRGKLDRHKFHITKLETLLRLLDNDGVEVDQIRRIKDDVEYYIDSSQEPDFEENEYIYDDIIGIEDVELSGTGIPSSATTDSNNSNETGGSPSSSALGTSPVQSPAALNCSNANNLNYSSDSTSVEFTAADKRNKNENNPVKPTAVRASNKADANSNSSSTNSSGSTTQNKLISSTPSKNPSHAINLSSTTTSLSVINSQQAIGNSIISNATGTNVQAQSVIQSTPPIAFAAVAKNNTSHLESDHHQQNSSFTMASSAAVGSQLSGANSLQQNSSVASTQQSNSSHSSSNGATTTTNAIPISAAIVHTHPNASIGSSTGITAAISSIVDSTSSSSLNSTSGTIVSSLIVNSSNSNSAVTNTSVGGGNSANILTNCISPISNSVVNSSRTSPSPISPKQINGPANLKCVPPTMTVTSSVTDAMSSLKTIAQDAINRASVDTSILAASVNVDLSRQQQQQQQLQQQQQQQSAVVAAAAQHFSPAVTDATTTSIVATNGPTSVSGAIVQSSGGGGVKAPTNEAHIPPLLGVAPLGPSPLHKEHQFQFQMMEAAYYHLPQPCDSEKLTTYFHRQPVQTPPHYPQTQLPHSDTVEFFQRLSTETLFFVFYYMEGTKAQYLAAKALKKQSWRFHTKYMMWFQRHEEPKIINDDYEQGTYIYFDYEKWGQRKKEGFTFEYKYLEDKDLN